MTFDDHLALITDRSAALRSAVAAAPSLDTKVPGCPDWTLADLIEHLGGVQMFWAVVVSSADASGPPPRDRTDFDSPTGDQAALVEWSASATGQLLDALRTAGPSSPSWAWWGASGAPLTAAAVARHQVQEAAVHARDAEETIGRAAPLPAPVAVDGLAEFLSVPLASLGAWPGEPVRVGFAASDGPTHVVDLSASGVVLDPGSPGEPALTVHGAAGELVLGLYGRVPLGDLRLEGDTALAGELLRWIDV
jgi:uncharacterized protein (TIGR03083 family)